MYTDTHITCEQIKMQGCFSVVFDRFAFVRRSFYQYSYVRTYVRTYVRMNDRTHARSFLWTDRPRNDLLLPTQPCNKHCHNFCFVDAHAAPPTRTIEHPYSITCCSYVLIYSQRVYVFRFLKSPCVFSSHSFGSCSMLIRLLRYVVN
jgi:hypothetical protein